MTARKWLLPEIWFTAAVLGLTLAIAALLGVRFSLPADDRAAFVGIHYLYPLIGVAVWGLLALVGEPRELGRTFFIALPCYAVVLLCHFNLKLRGSFINPSFWDEFYWQTDTWLRPLIDASIALALGCAWAADKLNSRPAEEPATARSGRDVLAETLCSLRRELRRPAAEA